MLHSPCINQSNIDCFASKIVAIRTVFFTILFSFLMVSAGYAQINYVRSFDITAPISNASEIFSRPLSDVKMSTQYLDGLGRPVQTVSKKGSLQTSNNVTADLISINQYDEFGREPKQYLPFVASTGGGNTSVTDGFYKTIVTPQQDVFYPSQYPGENYFYNKTNFEPSPLNRVQNSFAPGNSWAGSEGNPDPATQRNVQMKYYINTLTDAVRIWNTTIVTNKDQFDTYSSPGFYPAGELFKNITIDESKNQVIEFKDKDGKVVLKKVQLTAVGDAGTGTDYTGWLCTYYIYDDLKNLSSVVQPEAVRQMAFAGNWDLTSYLNEQCFRYKYDEHNRMIMKKVPGAGEVYMVYDQRDRLVMTQDANMRGSSKWLVTKYDELNRPYETGLWVSGTTFMLHLSSANTSSNYPTISGTYDLLTNSHYDNYTSLPAGLSSSFLTTWNTNFNTSSSWPYPQMPVQSTAIKGLVAWTQTRVVGTTLFLNTAFIYDDKNRPIQVQSTNVAGGTDVTTTQYSWTGQPLVNVLKQEITGSNPQIHVVITKINYDDLGRVLNIKKTINSNIGGTVVTKPEQTIASNEYDALGQLKIKNIEPGYNGTDRLQKLTYDYNIRGWLLGANRNFVKDLSATNTTNSSIYFGFDLGYDKTIHIIPGASYLTPQYNGNIEGMTWKSIGDGETRKYDFDYDAANRLMKADFRQYAGNDFIKNPVINFDVIMGNGNTVTNDAYDANGNIKKMQQWGLQLNTSSQIDNLTYSYFNGSNKLAKVEDGSGDNHLGDFKDGTNPGDDYAYDANGNLSIDNNKAIGNLSYNYLNLPNNIIVTGKGNITYTYDAGGNKLQKQTLDNSIAGKTITTTTKYLGGFIYESKTTSPADPNNLDYTDILQFAGHEEGRIRFKPAAGAIPTGFAFDYFLKDHLGNVRMVLTNELQQDQYPAATMETANTVIKEIEEKLYAKIPETRTAVAQVPGYPTDNTTNPNAYVGLTNGSGNKIGPNIILKVMAGDKFNVKVSSWYKLNGTPQNPSNSTILSDMVNNLVNGVTGNAALNTHGATVLDFQNNTSVSGGLQNFLTNQNNQTNSGKPKAYINWVLFDEQFKIVESANGFEQVNVDDQLELHVRADLPVAKNGFLYIYVSNETQNYNVYFDNLQVTHTRGPILEETHYYPFGLTMAGISSMAFQSSSPDCGCPSNKKGYNGNDIQNKEFSDGSGLELYDFNARTYDHQIGRFIQIDPFAEMQGQEVLTPYHFSLNNPVTYSDPTGKCPWCIGAVIGGVGGFIYGAVKHGFKNGGWKKVLATTAAGAIGGATMGLGTGAIIGAGGAATMSAAGATMAEGGVAILSGAASSLTDQGISMALGAQDKFDGADLAYSMTLAVPELLLSKAVVDPIGNSVKSELSGAITDGAINTLTAKERGGIVKDVAKNLRKEIGSGITRKQSKTAAEKIVNMMEKTEQNTIGVGIKITNNAVNVSGVVVGNAVDDASKEKIQNQ